MASASGDKLRRTVINHVLEAMLPHLAGWVETLGQAGSPDNKGVSAQVRVSAAKTGIEFVTRFLTTGQSPPGESLLKQLEALEEGALASTEPERTESGDWSADPIIPGKATRLEPSGVPDSLD